VMATVQRYAKEYRGAAAPRRAKARACGIGRPFAAKPADAEKRPAEPAAMAAERCAKVAGPSGQVAAARPAEKLVGRPAAEELHEAEHLRETVAVAAAVDLAVAAKVVAEAAAGRI
jgi:hypothetical protein